MTSLRWGSASDKGRVRPANEDRPLVAEPIFAVADGMGGHQAGEVASQIAVETLRESVGDTTTDALVEGVRLANEAVYSRAAGDPDLRGMGTTLCAIALVRAHGDGDGTSSDGTSSDGTSGDERIAVVNVGDSRVYRLQQGELEQLTVDHTLVQTLVDDRQITAEEAAVHPQRNIVTRALGIEPDVEIDAWELIPYTGDRFLLCSDGLFNEVEESQIASVLRRLQDPDEAARELVRLANEGGGRDNITCVVVDVVDDDGRGAQASAAVANEVRGRSRSTRAARSPDVAGFETAVPPQAPPPSDVTGIVSPVPRTSARTGAPTAAPAQGRPPGHGSASRSQPAGPPGEQARHRRLTWRVAVFMLAVLAVLGAAGTAVWWYARNTYYVGVDAGQVAIYRGRPGGVLWFHPTIEERTKISEGDVPDSVQPDLASGQDQPTLAAAERYVANLRRQIDELASSGRTTTTTTVRPSTTSTSRPGGGTTAKPRPSTTTTRP